MTKRHVGKERLMECDNLESVKEYSGTLVTRNGSEAAVDTVMMEHSFDLLVNGIRISTIATTDEHHRELAAGHLICEGVIDQVTEIEAIVEKPGLVELSIPGRDFSDSRHKIHSAGGLGIYWKRLDETVTVPLQQKFCAAVLLDSLGYLSDVNRKRTAGAHSASLIAADGTLLHMAVDVGRHNAIDKVVGMAALNGDDRSRLFLLSSGRQPGGMVMKAAWAGIPLIISKGAPISSGIEIARRSNVTLCCFSTTEKTTVFSVSERIVMDSEI